MPRPPARSVASTVAILPGTEIPASHFRQGRTSPPFPISASRCDALRGTDAVVLALRFAVLKNVIDQIADPLTGKLAGRPLTGVAGVFRHGMLVSGGFPRSAWC